MLSKEKNKESIEEQFERNIRQASGANPIFPYAAKQEMGKMVDIILEGNQNIDKLLTRQNTPEQLGGFIAEEFHAETFNLDATLKNDDARAYTDMYEEWYDFKCNGKELHKNDTSDIIVTRDGEVTTTAQSKYNSTAKKTSEEMSAINTDGTPKYKDMDQMLGPSDQVSDIEKIGKKPSATGSQQQTAEKVRDRLSDGESSSTPLTKKEANTLGSGDKSKLQDIESSYQTQSTLKHMKKSATNAAAMTAVISGSVNTVTYIAKVSRGEMDIEEASLAIIKETACSAADSAVKAAANTGVQSLMARYGSEKIIVQSFAQQSLKSMMKANAVTVGVVCAIDAVKDIVRLGTGEISKKEFYERQGKNILTTSAGVVGGSLGVTAAGSVITSMGLTGALAEGLLLAGGLSGGLIAGLAMTLAIENGIEKPYRDLVQNTQLLTEATQELYRVSQGILQGQRLFTQFTLKNIELDQAISLQMNKIDQAGNNALTAILKI